MSSDEQPFDVSSVLEYYGADYFGPAHYVGDVDGLGFDDLVFSYEYGSEGCSDSSCGAVYVFLK